MLQNYKNSHDYATTPKQKVLCLHNCPYQNEEKLRNKKFFKNFIIICHNYSVNFSIFVAQYSINNPTMWLLIAGT